MFKGNCDLRAEGETVEMTLEQQQEWFKCANDPLYFSQNYFNIITSDSSIQLFNPYEYQKKTMKVILRDDKITPHTIIMWPRQMGKCVYKDTKITIRNKKIENIENITIENFHNKYIKNNKIISDKKFVETFYVNEYEVLTENGWKDIISTNKTIKYQIWELRTKSFSLKCADNHLIILENNKKVFVRDLKINDRVRTKNGIENIEYIKSYKELDNMYDLSIDSKEHTYYTNGILSHNTTTLSALLTHYALFNENFSIAIMANKQDTAIEIVDRIKIAYEKMPLWLQQGIKSNGWNSKSLLLENGSKIFASATSSASISGKTINILYIDEFSKIPDHICDQFVASTFPVISSGEKTKIIITSTPFGMNTFYDFWKGAINKLNNFFPIRVNWWEHPNRDENWKKKQIKTMNGNIIKFNQEYNCQFLGSSSTLIESETLERVKTIEPVSLKWSSALQIFEEPKPNVTYVLGIDTAKGVGNDYSIIQVLKIIDDRNVEQVATYRNNMISPYDYASVCLSIAQYYNDAYMMVESNSEGGEVLTVLWYDFEYENICNCDKNGLGIRSTKTSKLHANLLLKEYMEKGWLKINNKNTIYELSRYVEVTPNVFKSETQTTHDDEVTSLLWGLWFIRTPFYDGKTTDRTIDSKYNLTDDSSNDTPFVYVDDGLNMSSVYNDMFDI